MILFLLVLILVAGALITQHIGWLIAALVLVFFVTWAAATPSAYRPKRRGRRVG